MPRGGTEPRQPAARRRYVVWLCVTAGLATPLRPGLAVTLSADFDSASLDVAASSLSGGVINLVGRDNYNTGDWKWLYFLASDLPTPAPTFRIDDDFAGGGSNLVGHAMAYSYDQQHWEFFDNNVRNAGAGAFTFWNDAAFTGPEVYVAYGIPYPRSRAAQHTATVAASGWVLPTLSGGGSLAVGLSPGGVDDLGRTIAPSELSGYRIVDPVGAASRPQVVLTSGVHANETLGNLVLEGLVDFLVGDSLQAGLLRKASDLFVYPMVNPDGRLAGYNRGTVARPDDDPNRYWAAPGYGGIAELQEVGAAMISDTGGAADYLIDFHSTVDGKDGHYGFVLPAMQSDPLWQSFLAREPQVLTRNALLVDDTTAKFGRDTLGAGFSITFETQFIAGENEDRFLAMGESWGLALADALLVFADLNLDGRLDGADWSRMIAGAETDLSMLPAADAYLRGDLDGDGVNSIADFGIFQHAYTATHGPAAFARLFAAVPEPSASRLAAGVLLTLCVYGACRTPPFRGLKC
ncbi:Zinc carboxypeptidase [Pirellulimonas nuda]|uniref:Zinc carboxypeptidase n=1 Tax=Pirellulimonas nuda TaxID=2528009 RepID=A0A518DCE3_9BACT|nr:M14 family zinc carboxypeptidase [Pirellulimonas nuda]QDU89152.1 Zinc carboxypeptidase [Pirellulimonas nuda]